jgi:hypothetical protein
MELGGLIVPLGIAGAAALGAGASIWYVRARCYVAVPPNRALVLFGRHAVGRTSEVGARATGVDVRRPRVVVGGGAFVAPWEKGIGHLSLDPVSADVTVRAMHALEGSRASGWEVRLQAQARISPEPGPLATAAENLIDKTEAEIRSLLRQTVEGVVPTVLTRLRPEEGEPDWDRLAAEIQASVAPELVRWGLGVSTLSVTELRRIVPADPPGPSGSPRSALAPGVSGGAARLANLLEAFDVRLARTEMALGKLADDRARERDERDELDAGVPPVSVFDLSLGTERATPIDGASALPASVHESMGGDRSPRSRPPSRDGWAEEGGRDTRSLSD